MNFGTAKEWLIVMRKKQQMNLGLTRKFYKRLEQQVKRFISIFLEARITLSILRLRRFHVLAKLF